MLKIKKGTKISDLAGSWDMSDEEAEEIAASIRKMWRNAEIDLRLQVADLV
jgi:hypothetical protein